MKESLPEKEIVARVEAALYSSGRPMSIEELVKATGLNSREKIKKILLGLTKKINEVFYALELKELEDGNYVLQLKSEYGSLIRKFAKQPILQSSALKTLSYVVYEQPITSKRLVHIRGTQAYSHVKYLEQLGFIEHESVGRLKVYKTTKKFQDYFGISDLNIIKDSISLNR
ncbi:MAG TPA: SMC-Scp complex subunit ScpB [Nitrososphaeraceae archaeon]|nr:SMC-Scp complex subunit ScpB [Nitrososphaeraceae archaeon]